MAHWLVKSESESWSWAAQVAAGVTQWDGVRNHQAANAMKAMRVGEQAFFYHSGSERRIIGIVEVAHEYYLDPSDPSGRFGMVDMRTVAALPVPVTLAEIKADSRLAHIALVRQSRLSVMPIDDDAWSLLSAMGGVVS